MVGLHVCFCLFGRLASRSGVCEREMNESFSFFHRFYSVPFRVLQRKIIFFIIHNWNISKVPGPLLDSDFRVGLHLSWSLVFCRELWQPAQMQPTLSSDWGSRAYTDHTCMQIFSLSSFHQRSAWVLRSSIAGPSRMDFRFRVRVGGLVERRWFPSTQYLIGLTPLHFWTSTSPFSQLDTRSSCEFPDNRANLLFLPLWPTVGDTQKRDSLIAKGLIAAQSRRCLASHARPKDKEAYEEWRGHADVVQDDPKCRTVEDDTG